MRNVFHHLEFPESYFKALTKYIKQDGRIAIIDWMPGGAHIGHCTPEEMIISVMDIAGYSVAESPDVLDKQSYNIFRLK
jgi:hypothetical protein